MEMEREMRMQQSASEVSFFLLLGVFGFWGDGGWGVCGDDGGLMCW